MWLNWLGIIPHTKRHPVQSSVRAHAQVMGSIPGRDMQEAAVRCIVFTLMLLSFPPPLKINKKINLKNK